MPIVDHAHSPPTLSGAGPPSSLVVDLGHWNCVLRTADSRGAGQSVTSFPRSTGVAPPSSGRTLHHESPDPPGDPVSAPPPPRPTSSMGGSTPWDVQPRGLDLRRTHHLRGGRHYLKGCLPIHGRATATRCAALSAPMNPLHRRRPLTMMSIHPCSHARQLAWWPVEIHRPRHDYPIFLES
jgi:hypothetical protein